MLSSSMLLSAGNSLVEHLRSFVLVLFAHRIGFLYRELAETVR